MHYLQDSNPGKSERMAAGYRYKSRIRKGIGDWKPKRKKPVSLEAQGSSMSPESDTNTRKKVCEYLHPLTAVSYLTDGQPKTRSTTDSTKGEEIVEDVFTLSVKFLI